MPCVVTQPAPGRLQIREGGGALTLFGLPFFAVGVFLLLSTAGLVTVDRDDPISTPAMVLLGTMFTIVGAILSFGRRRAPSEPRHRRFVDGSPCAHAGQPG
jgi:hypothetical protein